MPSCFVCKFYSRLNWMEYGGVTPSTGSTKVRYMGEKREIQIEAKSLIDRDLVMVLEKVLSCGAEGR